MTLRPLALILALALGVGASLLVGCGTKDTSGLIAAKDSDTLVSHLGALQNAVDLGKCSATSAALAQLQTDLSQLPATIDKDLKQELVSGYNRLKAQAGTECQEVATQRKPTTTTAATTTASTATEPVTTADTQATEPTTAETTPTTTSTTPNGGVSPETTTLPTPTTPPGVTAPGDQGQQP